MAIKTKQAILESLNAFIGENNSDDAITLVEDISDTLGDFESKQSDNTNWKEKYESNDKEWRAKYKERFITGKSDKDEEIEKEDTPKPLTFENLFKEE